MPDDDYPPESIRVLAGMEPRRRPTGHVEDVPDPAWLALPPDERAAALERAVRADRVAIGIEDLSDEEMARIMASKPIGPDYELPDD